MKAITQKRYGSADVLHLEEISRPVPGPDEVLIRVRAAGMDRGTWHFMTGFPYLGRLVFGLRVTGKLNLVRSMGADHTIDYTNEDFTDGSRRYDLIVD